MRNALDDPPDFLINGISELMDDLDQVSDTGFSFYRQDEESQVRIFDVKLTRL